MQRILIIGQPGSGKSTLSRQLSDGLALQCFDSDHLLRRTDGTHRTRPEFHEAINASIRQPRWVMNSNRPFETPQLFERTDTLVWLDYSALRTGARYLERSLSRLRDGERISGGHAAPSESFLKVAAQDVYWTASAFIRHRTTMRRAYAALFDPGGLPAHVTAFRLRAPAETQHFLTSLNIPPVPTARQSRDARNVMPQP